MLIFYKSKYIYHISQEHKIKLCWYLTWYKRLKYIYTTMFLYIKLIAKMYDFSCRTILSTSNRIPTRGQYQKRWSCLLPVDSCHSTTIVTSECTIVTSIQHLCQTIVQVDKTIVLPRNLQQEVYMTTFFATSP